MRRLDAASLDRLAFGKGLPGARYNAVPEEGVPLREIAEAFGRGMKVPVVAKSPEEAREQFGWFGAFVGPRHSGLKRAYAGTAGMAPNSTTGANRRSRCARFQNLSYW